MTDRAMLLDHLALAREHVAKGEIDVARQRQILAELDRDGHDTALARELLQTMEETLALHVADRDRIEGELKASL